VEVRRSKRGIAGYPLIECVEPVMYGVIRVAFDDGYEAVLDLQPLMGRAIWKKIATKDDFLAIAIDDYGADISWPRGEGLTSLPADGVRLECERQQAVVWSLYERQASHGV
jgi:hypothetical protein